MMFSLNYSKIRFDSLCVFSPYVLVLCCCIVYAEGHSRSCRVYGIYYDIHNTGRTDLYTIFFVAFEQWCAVTVYIIADQILNALRTSTMTQSHSFLKASVLERSTYLDSNY